MTAAVRVGNVTFGGGAIGFILGPCLLESRELALRVAAALAALRDRSGAAIVFKGSFDKANRTSPRGERGPGIDTGLRWLEDVRAATGLPVLTDVHEPGQCAAAAAVCDALQVPAFLCRQTDLIVAAAAHGRPVLLKKGQFLAPEDMQYATAKAAAAPGVLLGERGTSFGYRDLVVDMRGLVVMRAFAPVVFDGTHSVQQPGAAQGQSGGDRRFVAPLCRAALAVGVDGFFLEAHPDPERAASDRQTQLHVDDATALVQSLLALHARLS